MWGNSLPKVRAVHLWTAGVTFTRYSFFKVCFVSCSGVHCPFCHGNYALSAVPSTAERGGLWWDHYGAWLHPHVLSQGCQRDHRWWVRGPKSSAQRAVTWEGEVDLWLPQCKWTPKHPTVLYTRLPMEQAQWLLLTGAKRIPDEYSHSPVPLFT